MSQEELTDPPLPSRHLPPLESQPWEPVDQRYLTVVRQRLSLWLLPPAVSVALAGYLFDLPSVWFWYGLSGALFGLFLVLFALWAPRWVRRLGFVVRERDVNVRRGYLWYREVSVALNRIQHVEVRQGPLERLHGLSALSIFTAGGAQSDMALPGLATDLAWQLKAHLTGQVAEEAAPADAGEHHQDGVDHDPTP